MIAEKKLLMPPTRGRDSTGWKNGWFQLAMLGGSACTLHKVVGQEGGAGTLPPARLAERYLISTKSVAVMVLTPLASSRVPTT